MDESSDLSSGVAPMVPSRGVRAELEAYLEQDSTALGDVWRRTTAGESPEQIQAARGTAYPNFVWNNNRLASALLDGDLPTAPTLALSSARKFRKILSVAKLSPGAVQVLTINLRELERRSSDSSARDVEERQALASTTQAESEAETGIYVYALPHYLRYPYDPESGRTLLKVGHSGRDVVGRFIHQTRTTALPEEPVLLRVYATGPNDSAHMESAFHELLESADHARSAARTGGTEWFLTSLRYLDVIAKTLSLKTRVVFDPQLSD